MTVSKNEYRAARKASVEAWQALSATPEHKAYEAAKARSDKMEEELGEIETCDGCNAPVFEGDPRTHDHENSATYCVDCSPTWADFQQEPDSFYENNPEGELRYYTLETAKPLIDAHLASGGTLSDTMAKVPQ
ncbi:hypothetical protein QEZ52_00505 [Aliisedimentitalea scapharcae]|uniref:Uncharacterized protein n=1 Tax=Aliisedimentitalea scapharcae TaxID=1524259 RepID=A0ABZ2XSJ6_9RHOB